MSLANPITDEFFERWDAGDDDLECCETCGYPLSYDTDGDGVMTMSVSFCENPYCADPEEPEEK